jgi:hypothetical protein
MSERRVERMFRVLPRRGNSLLSTVFAVIFLVLINSGVGTSGSMALTRPPVVWITARIDPDRYMGRGVYGIGMSGYVAHTFNPFSSEIDGIVEISS